MQALDQQKALVLFSGGQDSSIALVWALERYERVETIGFDYGQRHAVELGARLGVRRAIEEKFPQLGTRLGDDAIIDFTAFGRMSDTAMTSDAEIETPPDGLPNTFVPGRNLAFLVFAAAHAHAGNAGVLVAGMCEADYSGYPDCREEAIKAQENALRLGMDADFHIATPLMHVTKAESWALAERIGGKALVETINEKSHTCYKGVRGKRHDWGYGCGECPACVLRKKGWEEYTSNRR